MTITADRFQTLLCGFELEELFNELGWDRPTLPPQSITADGEPFTLTQLAHKRGVAVFACSPDGAGTVPQRARMLRIEREAAKLAREHLLIFTDVDQTTQTWLWVSLAPGQPTITRTHTWHTGQSGESLRQKLAQIVWSLEQEAAITLTDVITGLKRAFDRDKVSKGFYDRFKAQHETFAQFIKGLSATTDRDWYASLMLNRLMFVYFIQKKGFLDGDTNYLTHRMAHVRATLGQGKFHSFYRQFLRRLFHEGLGQPKAERDPELTALIGNVPYLNGGLFDVHALEEANPGIEVPDEAFEKLFEFFNAWDWHLDDRPLAKGNEINPDVLGYIFEKYINQKQMGAYYTKEDITEYISKNTVVPHLIEQARERCPVAFDGEASVWRLLKTDPDRYIYPAMKTGVVDATGQVVPESALPDFVQIGMHDAKARMFERRYNLGEAVFHTANGERGTLPTETWREYVDRRGRCLAIRKKLANGEVNSADDLITLNLDIRQFMQDVIDTCTSPVLLRAIWQAIVGRVPEKSNEKFRHGISILDPTCGSGAFLFAALNILEPLYEACLERMEGFIEDARKLGKPGEADFKKILAEVDRHPSRRYYIFKNIILHNLFGVDIMAEAVEICKLRLFLKLVSQVDAVHELEPLPDIDFNIRTGNTLVGYATEAQFDAANTLASDQGHRNEIKASIADLADLFDRFREQQTVRGGKVTADDKRALRDRLSALSLELDRYLARDYGIDPDHTSPRPQAGEGLGVRANFAAWRQSHQPFHWFAEFYGVMREGGFDVVIGNPPFVEYTKIKKTYSVAGAITLPCGNLHALVTERSLGIGKRDGRYGLVLPISAFSTARMQPLQDFCGVNLSMLWHSTYGIRPSKLFEGAEQRVCIMIARGKDKSSFSCYSAKHRRWQASERNHLFQTSRYIDSTALLEKFRFPKISHEIEWQAIAKLPALTLATAWNKSAQVTVFWHRIPAYFVKAVDFIPYFCSDRDGEKKSEDYKPFPTESALAGKVVGVLNSNLFYWYWFAVCEGYHCGKQEVLDFPVNLNAIARETSELATALMADLQANSVRKLRSQRTTDIEYDEFYPWKSKGVMDKIDLAIAPSYNLTDEETDFFINYDIKYRMGGADDEE